MLKNNELNNPFWVEALHTSFYIQHCSYILVLDNTTPFELCTCIKPNLIHFRKFCCQAYFHILNENCTKIKPQNFKIYICWV